jgi:hypothetical protein
MSDSPEPTIQRASDADLSALCRSCGLCCDGSLFGRVDLEAREVEGARTHRLRVVAGGRCFEQPCGALAAIPGSSGERACAVYEERPRSCRRFECRLYSKYRGEGGPIDEPLSVVRRARLLLARALDDANVAPPPAELTRLLDESFARA